MSYVQPLSGCQPAAVLSFLLPRSDSPCLVAIDCGTVAPLACPFLKSCVVVCMALCAAAAQLTSGLAASCCVAMTLTVHRAQRDDAHQ